MRNNRENQTRIARGLLVFLIGLSGIASARHPKIAKDLDDAHPHSMVSVIVQFKHPPTDAHHAKVLKRGGQFRSTLHIVKGGAYSVPAKALERLANDPEVAYISADRTVYGALDQAVTTAGGNIAHSYGWDGTGIGVAVLDSGVTSHPDLMNAKGDKSRIVYSQSFVGGGNDDHYGHGTHVAGVLGGNGKSTTGTKYTRNFIGMAPNVNIVNLRVLDQNGNGVDSNVIAAIQTAIQLKSTYNIRVMNLSLGRPVVESFTQDPLCQAVEAAWKAGITVVVAAGNDGRDNSVGNQGYSTISAPGNDPYVITVGAMKTNGTTSRTDDAIASYSAKGPTPVDHIVKPDIVAPGNLTVSLLASTAHLQQTYPTTTIPVSYYGLNSSATSNYYFRLSGTSLATPMVSGAAALLLQKQPGLTPDQVKELLMKNASKSFPASSVAVDPATNIAYTSYYDIFTIGAGYLDVMATLNDTESCPANLLALSPIAVVDSSTNLVYAVANPAPICSDSSQSGTSLFNSVCGNPAMWGTNALWGTNAVWGTNALWGTNAVWGTAVFQSGGSAELPPLGVAPIASGPQGWVPGSNQAANVVWGTISPWVNASSTISPTVMVTGEN